MDRKQQTLAILVGWHIANNEGLLYISSVHFLYIQEMAKQFRKVIILAPVKTILGQSESANLVHIDIPNVEVRFLPYWSSHIGALKYWKIYRRKIKEISCEADLFYCRVPDPFCWMPARYSEKPVIMHFVGDTIDATKGNINFSTVKKRVLLLGYGVEYKLIQQSAKLSTVYTNGEHIALQLHRVGIKAKPVVSSTISSRDMPQDLKVLSNRPFKLIYVGYLRYAKGIDTLIEVVGLLDRRGVNYEMHVVGTGEMQGELEKLNNPRVIMHGHINDRGVLYALLRSSDLFFFPSLSEGSPRVIIEAMSQGCPVLSTPVGSLPTTFDEGEEIMYFPFKNSQVATDKIIEMSRDLSSLTKLRNNAYKCVHSHHTIEQFINTITTLD